jgi:hypothetical protein
MIERTPESEPERREAEDALMAARPDPAPLAPDRSRAILEAALRSTSLRVRSGHPGGLFLFYRTAVALAVPLALVVALAGHRMRGSGEAPSLSSGHGGDILPAGSRYWTDLSAGNTPVRTKSDSALHQTAMAAGLSIKSPAGNGHRSRSRRFTAMERSMVSRRLMPQAEIPHLALALPPVMPAGFGEGVAVTPLIWVAEADPSPSTLDRPILRVATANVVPRLMVRVRTAAPSEVAGYARVSALRPAGGGRLVWYESTMAGEMTTPGLFLVGSASSNARSYR